MDQKRNGIHMCHVTTSYFSTGQNPRVGFSVAVSGNTTVLDVSDSRIRLRSESDLSRDDINHLKSFVVNLDS